VADAVFADLVGGMARSVERWQTEFLALIASVPAELGVAHALGTVPFELLEHVQPRERPVLQLVQAHLLGLPGGCAVEHPGDGAYRSLRFPLLPRLLSHLCLHRSASL